MPRFFFHIRSNGQGWSRDELGLDFPNVEIARREALRAAEDLESVFASRGQDPRDHAVEVEDESGEIVLHLSFSEIFDRQAGAAVRDDLGHPWPQARLVRRS